ncbi:MAG: class I SAM-dependent methyltransferase [Cyanobacteria bacterium P01_G01_bin.49]
MTQSTTIFPGEVFADPTLFDTGIRQLLPHYEQMLDTLVACVPSTTCRLLELGCGTGELGLKLLKRCPDAHLVAVDYSPRMLVLAEAKLTKAQLNHRVTFIQEDFGAWAKGELPDSIGTDFESCVSSLAIHHLTDEMKQQLFSCIGENLVQGGCFWNADPILQESSQLQEIYSALREKWTMAQGTTITEIRSQIGSSVPQGYSGQDRLATLESHCTMLTQAGFNTVAVPWRFLGLAIFGGWI